VFSIIYNKYIKSIVLRNIQIILEHSRIKFTEATLLINVLKFEWFEQLTKVFVPKINILVNLAFYGFET